ncbi:hypothetical protein EDD85DRAFT_857817 [Armillaria nabsnona]|nr:hypothetical protein EDD85DRAFT_857817 [Armillaria nabsnona]
MIVMAVVASPVTILTYGTLSSTSQMLFTISRIKAALAVLFPDEVSARFLLFGESLIVTVCNTGLALRNGVATTSPIVSKWSRLSR